MEKLGARLKRLRKEAGLTQATLATAVGLSQGTIGNIEAGIRGYGQSLLPISRQLGVPAEYLNCETDELSPPDLNMAPGWQRWAALNRKRSAAAKEAVSLGNKAAHGQPVSVEKMVAALRQIMDELLGDIDESTRQAASSLLGAYAVDPKKNAAAIKTLAMLLRASIEAQAQGEEEEEDEDPDPDNDGPPGQSAPVEADSELDEHPHLSQTSNLERRLRLRRRTK